MKKITPDIMLDDCGEKLEYYQQLFGGDLKNIRKTPDGEVMHAELHVKPDCALYFHDKFSFAADMVYGSVVLVLELESEEEINRMFNALKEDGGVRYDLQQTDWGALHAVVEDKHSVVWSLNYML
jgi:PhnB protein